MCTSTAEPVMSPNAAPATTRILTLAPSHAGEYRQRGERADLDQHVRRGLALNEAEREQAHDVHPQHPDDRAVAAAPDVLGQQLALGQPLAHGTQTGERAGGRLGMRDGEIGLRHMPDIGRLPISWSSSG